MLKVISRASFRRSNPAFYKQVFDHIHQANVSFFSSREAFDTLVKAPSFLVVYLAGWIVMIGWFFVAWGAYRELNRSSKARSALAACVFVPCFCLISFVGFLMAAAVVQ